MRRDDEVAHLDQYNNILNVEAKQGFDFDQAAEAPRAYVIFENLCVDDCRPCPLNHARGAYW